MNTDAFYKLVQYRMPFGRYKGYLLIDLPESYVVWFHQKGFPSGELRGLLGLDYLFENLRK